MRFFVGRCRIKRNMILGQLVDLFSRTEWNVILLVGLLSPAIGVIVAGVRGFSSSKRVLSCVLFYVLVGGIALAKMAALCFIIPLGLIIGIVFATFPPSRKS